MNIFGCRAAGAVRIGALAALTALAACAGPRADMAPLAASGPPIVPPSQIVFFDAGTAAITADAAEVLGRTLKDYARLRPPQVVIVGHADRAGGGQRNAALSAERAEAVGRHLVAHGVPASAIVTFAAGERQGLVGTPDGAAEAQNRRAEVYVVAQVAGRSKHPRGLARAPWRRG